jgi:hypothetical protein
MTTPIDAHHHGCGEMPLPWLHVQHPRGDGTSSDCSHPLDPRLESLGSSDGETGTYQATGDHLRRYHGELVVIVTRWKAYSEAVQLSGKSITIQLLEGCDSKLT